MRQALGSVSKLKTDVQRLETQVKQHPLESELIELQNKSTFLNKKIEELAEENQLLCRMNKKAAQDNSAAPIDFPSVIKPLREQVKQYSKLYNAQDRILRAKHKFSVTLEDNCRKLREFIRISKAALPSVRPAPSPTELHSLERQIEFVQTQKQVAEKRLHSQIVCFEQVNKEKGIRISSLVAQLKSLDLDCRQTMICLRSNLSRVPTQRRTSAPSILRSLLT